MTMRDSAEYKPEALAKEIAILRWRFRLVFSQIAHFDIAGQLRCGMPGAMPDGYSLGRGRTCMEAYSGSAAPCCLRSCCSRSRCRFRRVPRLTCSDDES